MELEEDDTGVDLRSPGPVLEEGGWSQDQQQPLRMKKKKKEEAAKKVQIKYCDNTKVDFSDICTITCVFLYPSSF